jgi:CMP-N-acetylneuraminic acid synthetase
VSAARVAALIPARGGSKSIPRKNVRSMAGHPLLAYSIEAARQAKSVDLVLVSTDDEEIREVALAYGAEAPFLRPSALAEDTTPDWPVFEHALRWLETERGVRPDLVVQLRPTSPLRPPGLVDEAIALLSRHPEADSLRAVTTPSQNPFKMWTLSGRYLRPLMGSADEELFNQPRQRLTPTLWQTGHLDLVRHKTLLLQGSMTGQCVLPLFIDPSYAIDIDTVQQWAFAEWLIEGQTLDIVRPLASASPPA